MREFAIVLYNFSQFWARNASQDVPQTFPELLIIWIPDQKMCSLMLKYFFGSWRIAVNKLWLSVNILSALL